MSSKSIILQACTNDLIICHLIIQFHRITQTIIISCMHCVYLRPARLPTLEDAAFLLSNNYIYLYLSI